MATPLRPAGKGKNKNASPLFGGSAVEKRPSNLQANMARYIQKLRDYFGWNLRNKKSSADCSRDVARLQQEIQRLQSGTAEYTRTQKKLSDTQADLERLQMESADSNRRYASELQQLESNVETSKADHEAEIQMLKANEARLIQDIEAGGDVNLSGAYNEISRLQGMLSETQRAYTQKNSDLTRAVTDFSNQTLALKDSYDAQIVALNRDLSSCQTNFKKINSDFTALNSAYLEQNSSIVGSLTSFDSKVRTLTQQFGDFSLSLDRKFTAQDTSTDGKLTSLDGKFTKMFGSVSETLDNRFSAVDRSIQAAQSATSSLFERRFTEERATTNSQIDTEKNDRTGYVDRKIDAVKNSLSNLFESRLVDERNTTNNTTDAKVEKASFSLSKSFDSALTSAQDVYDRKIKSALETARAVAKGDIAIATQETVDKLRSQLDTTSSGLQDLFESKLADVQSTSDAKIANEQVERKSGLMNVSFELNQTIQATRDASKGDFSNLKSLFETKLTEERALTDSQVTAEGRNTDGKVEKASTGLKSYFTEALDDAQILYDVKIKNALEIARSVAKGDIAIATKETMDTLQSKLDTTASKVNDAFDSQLGRITGLETFQSAATKAFADSQSELKSIRSNIEDQFSTVGTAIQDVKSKYTTIEAKFDSSFAEASTRLNSLDTSLARLDASTNLKVTNLTNRFEETVNTATKTLTTQFGLSLDVLSNIVNVNTQTFKVALENKIDGATASLGSKLQGLGVDVDSVKSDFSSKFSTAFSSIDGLTSGLQQANRSITSVVDDVKTVAGKFDDVSRALGDVTADFKSKFGSVDAVIDTLDKTLAGRIDTVHDDIKTTAGAVSNLENTFNKQVSNFQSDLQSVSQAAESATNTLAESTGKSIAALEEDAKTVVNRAANTAKSILESRFNSLEAATTTLQNDAITVVDRAAKETTSRLDTRFSDLEVATTNLTAKTATVVNDAVAVAKSQLESRFATLEITTSVLGDNGSKLLNTAMLSAEDRFKDKFLSIQTATNILGDNGSKLLNTAMLSAETQFKSRMESLTNTTNILGTNGTTLINNAMLSAETRFKTNFDAIVKANDILGTNGTTLINNAMLSAETRFKARMDSLTDATTILGTNGTTLINNAMLSAETRFKARMDSLADATTILGTNGTTLINNAMLSAETRFKARMDSLADATTILGTNGTTLLNNAMLSAEARFKNNFDAITNATTILGTNGQALIDRTLTTGDSRYASIGRVVALENRVGTTSDDLMLTAKSGRAVIAATSASVTAGPALEVELNAGANEVDDLVNAWEAMIPGTTAWRTIVPFKSTATVVSTTSPTTNFYYTQTLPNNKQLPIRWVSSWKRWLALVQYKKVVNDPTGTLGGSPGTTTTLGTYAFTSTDGVTWAQTAIGSANFVGIEFAENPSTGVVVVLGATDTTYTAPATVRGTYTTLANTVLWTSQALISFKISAWATVLNATADMSSTVSASAACIFLDLAVGVRVIASTSTLVDIKFANGAFIAVGGVKRATSPTGYGAPVYTEGSIIRSTDGITWASERVDTVGSAGSTVMSTVVYGDTGGTVAIPTALKGTPFFFTSLAYSPTLGRWIAHDSSGYMSAVSENNRPVGDPIWKIYASTSNAQMTLVNTSTSKALFYMSNVTTTWSSALNAFVLCCPDTGIGASFLISQDGYTWTHPTWSGMKSGVLLKIGTGVLTALPSQRAVMLSIPDMEMFGFLYVNGSNAQLVYTRNGSDWTQRSWSVSAGSLASLGLSVGWSSDQYQMVVYGLPGTGSATSVYMYSTPSIALTTLSRRAPVRVGTTTDTGLALYTGSNKPQLTILPGEGGVEIQTKLVIGNTVITESQLVKLLALIS